MTMGGDRRRRRGRTGTARLFAAGLAIGLPLELGAETMAAEPVPPPRSRPAVVKAVRLPVARPPAQNAPVAHGGVNETCLARLRSLGVEFTPVLPIAASRGCRVPAPVAISEIAPGVRLKPESRLNCQTAEALATWVRDVVLPTAVTELGSRPTALVHDSTYICRRRNNRPDGKLSKHASGNAVDIRAITFADRDTVLVRQRDGSASAEKRFQARIRRDACRYFTTVLGPGTNAAHATHFHFDLASRKGGYRLCQ